MEKQSSYHICFVAPTIYPYYRGCGCGGAELQIKMLADVLADRGHQVTVLTYSNDQIVEEFFGKVRVLKCPLRFLGGSNLFFLVDTYNFIRKIRKLNPDFLLMKTPNIIIFLLVLAAKYAGNTRVVKIFASDNDCCQKNNISGIFYRIGMYFADGLVFQTNFQKNLYEWKRKTSNPVIRNIFIPPENDMGMICPKDIELLWVGALTAEKQPDKLLELAQMMPNRRFTVISKATSDQYRKIEIDLRGLPNVDFLGKVPFDQIQIYFNRAKILLCTSQTEGFPNTFLQGWYGGCAIISLAYPCDGILVQCQCGYVSGSIGKMREDIETLLGDEDTRKQTNANGRAYMYREHDLMHIVDEYIFFLSKLKNHKCHLTSKK